MENELVSVVIPTYNRESTILQCVDSVLKQTYRNIEVIVVDDASTDNTYKLFEDYPDARVRYVKYSKNQGACYARNYGASLSKGAYIAFQDSDDLWVKDKLKKQFDYMQEKDLDFVFCSMDRINPISDTRTIYPDDFSIKGDILSQLLQNNAISTQTILLRKQCMDKIQFDVTFRRYQDWDFALQAASSGVKIGFVPESLVISTIQTNSISVNVKSGEAYEHLVTKHKELYSKYPKSAAVIYKKMGNSFIQFDKKKARYYYQKSLRSSFSLKVAIKWLISVLFDGEKKYGNRKVGL